MTISGADIPYFTLNNGTKIPSVGMGCWMGEPGGGEAVRDMCVKALAAGYRHFDTAAGYSNEEQVGAALRESGIPREELFVTTKLGPDHEHVRERLDESLEKLGLDYVDLYLIHWPFAMKDDKMLSPDQFPTIVDTWKQMEKLLDTGKVKSIGVSNFSIKTLSEILPHCKVIPAINQVETHPYLPHHGLKKFCESHGIRLTAYSPLGQPPAADKQTTVPALFADATIAALSKKHGATTAQVLISWCVQRGVICIPKSANVERMTKNITLLKFDDADMQTIDNLHKEEGKHRQLIVYPYSQPREVFGYKYEWLGWNRTAEGLALDDE
ncbi:hypothetical protein EWM64_g2898 [Hericium alpestre]|uniref:NADP-dependent oxidoreductase domain-containing protein n=1 Tax=Hericium alpestre TaxID=135208 RepID=A0A4Z0A3U9_9AGAM|nr:hypothetical protein EWM64_g2898 [Hericium alpestre]